MQEINASRGRILDDDKVITTLETLKTEAAEIMRKVGETEALAREVEVISNQYARLASDSSAIYFAMENLAEVCVVACKR